VKIHKINNLKPGTWRRMGKPGRLFVFMVAGVFLTACATAPENTENSIAERAQDRWEALLAGDYETAYAFYSPGYRSTKSVVDFAIGVRSRRVRWTSAEYMEHSCLENSCTVLFNVGFTVNRPVPGMKKFEGSNTVEEKWVKTEGQWWYFPKKG
jgi:hypothetical protein